MLEWTLAGNIMGPPGPPGLVSTAGFVYGEIPAGAINGTNKLYTVDNSFLANTLEVYLNGLRQRRVDDYNEISDTEFEFVLAPRVGDTVSVDYSLPPEGIVAVYGEIPAGAINGLNRDFSTAYIYVPTLLGVFLSGLRLRRTDDYLETGAQTFQLVTAPEVGDSICVDYMQG